jgi:ParB family chromosome partitioning protein
LEKGMTTRGNRGFADMIAGEGARSAAARLPPRTGILGSRENRLSELVSGAAVTRVHELIDPARCRIWEGHNRDYAALDEAACADLIESLRAQGRQEVAAIVRRVSGDPRFDFEVICGARRHWSVSWLRLHDYPDVRFLIEPRELTDEEAFRVADLENRSRKDLSDYERATDYARAIERYYGGSQQRMVDRLQVTKSWLSRYLELAKLPSEVVACFESPHVIGISHAARLAPLLRAPVTRRKVLYQAEALAVDQAARVAAGLRPLPAPAVVARLAADPGAAASMPGPAVVVRDAGGSVVARASQGRAGDLTIVFPGGVAADPAGVRRAVDQVLAELGPSVGRRPRTDAEGTASAAARGRGRS